METGSAALLLFLIMDPLGNVPLFLSLLKDLTPQRRRIVLARELLIALVVLFVFLFGGRWILELRQVRPEAVSIAGGIILFLSGLKMIWSIALLLAWAGTAVILFSSTTLYRWLGIRTLTAVERLMGMLLVALSVQMLLDGVASYLRSPAVAA